MSLLNALTAREIVDQLGGLILGDPSTVVTDVGTIQNASKGEITFYSDRSLSQYLALVELSLIHI